MVYIQGDSEERRVPVPPRQADNLLLPLLSLAPHGSCARIVNCRTVTDKSRFAVRVMFGVVFLAVTIGGLILGFPVSATRVAGTGGALTIDRPGTCFIAYEPGSVVAWIVIFVLRHRAQAKAWPLAYPPASWGAPPQPGQPPGGYLPGPVSSPPVVPPSAPPGAAPSAPPRRGESY